MILINELESWLFLSLKLFFSIFVHDSKQAKIIFKARFATHKDYFKTPSLKAQFVRTFV